MERGDIVQTLELPCGNCIGCRLERSRQWSVRIMHEASLHECNYFLTLTYDDDHLPADLSLNYKHVQDFLKRYRKQISPTKIRYFFAGEYGDLRLRPHYHACIFGHVPDDLVLFSERGESKLYTSSFLSQLWFHGFSSVGILTADSAAYVARYVVKKISGPMAERHYEIMDPITGEITRRTPEFAKMSLKPGIGAGWFDKYHTDVFPHDMVLAKGHAVKPPRYYDKLMTERNPDMMEEVKYSRVVKALDRVDDNTTDRLRVKEAIANRRTADYLKRRLK